MPLGREQVPVALLTIAAVQPSLTWLDPEGNCAAIRDQIGDLVATEPIDLIVLPEAFDGAPPELVPSSSAARIQTFLAELAGSTRTTIVGGSVAYRRADNRIVNACFIADRTGRIAGEYLKQRLFAAELSTRSAGKTGGCFEVDGMRVGVLICSDLWYPELAREFLDHVDVVCVPAKTTVPGTDYVQYARTLWLSLALTRAMENAVPVAVSDWCEGSHATGYTSGASSVNDPSGRPDTARVQQCLPDGRPGAVIARIDLDAVRRIRQYRREVGLLPPEGPR
jgi:predicted amidohydrolase